MNVTLYKHNQLLNDSLSHYAHNTTFEVLLKWASYNICLVTNIVMIVGCMQRTRFANLVCIYCIVDYNILQQSHSIQI